MPAFLSFRRSWGFLSFGLLGCGLLLNVPARAEVLVDDSTPGYYNDSLGTILDGTAPEFPLPFFSGGGDPNIYPADEPDLTAASAVLGDWLAPDPVLNGNWSYEATIPSSWTLNAETAVIYVVSGGEQGVAHVRGDFDADNGLFVWVNGQYKFGAVQSGLPSPAGQFEYANVDLGSLTPGTNYIQILREDNGISTGYQVRIRAIQLEPVISQQPLDQAVTVGDSAVFNVPATGARPFTYQWHFDGDDMAGGTNSSLVLTNVQIAQAGEYSVTISNIFGSVTSSHAVLTVNRPPIADAGASEMLVVSSNGSNAVAVLNGSLSSDPDGDPLTYQWFLTGEASPFASEVIAIIRLPLGTNPLTLVVHDGMALGRQDFAVEVITTSEAVDRLAELVQSGEDNPQPLLTSLEAALASMERSQPEVAINQLEAFKNKVLAQLMPVDPELAEQLLADAQAIIEALNGGSPTEVPLEITSIRKGNNGKPHLSIHGRDNRTMVIEVSTNLLDWTPLGVATECSEGAFEFEDSQSMLGGMQYYRVISPK